MDFLTPQLGSWNGPRSKLRQWVVAGWGLGMTHVSRHGMFSSKIFIVSYKQSISAQQQQPSTQTNTQTFICSVFCRYKVRGAAR